MRIRAAVTLALALFPLFAHGQRTPPERQPIGAREMERAQDELVSRRKYEAPVKPLRSANLRDAVRDFQANDFKVAPMHLVFGEFITASGYYFVAMHFDASLPADVTTATLFGTIDDNWSMEEPVTLQRAADGTAYYERSFQLKAGNHNATFGFAVNGTPVAMASAPMALRELAKNTRGVSRLLVSKHVFNLDKVQAADDPFAFGGIKVAPEADLTFHKSDELWIFFEAQNPGVDDTGAPKLTTSVTLEGNGKTKRGLAGDATPVALKGVPGHFGVGTTVDVSRLTPGEYLLRVSVEDAVAQQKYELLEKVAIVE